MGALALKSDVKRKVAVIGMGITGRSCIDWLLLKGHEVVAFDTREQFVGAQELRQQYPDIELVLGALDVDRLKMFDQIICSPGVSIKDPALRQLIDQKYDVVGDVELFAQEVVAPVIAITGSNGKSTVTTLVGEILQAAGMRVGVAGNIGKPVLEALEERDEVYVLELSSFQLDTTHSLRPKVSVVLNVSPDHMDRYDSYQEYVASKEGIYRNAELCIVNRDDPEVAAMRVGKNVLGFTLTAPDDNDYGLRVIDGEQVLCKGARVILSATEMALSGTHNYANALAALAICEGLGVDEETAKTTLRRFTGLEHRTQVFVEKDGVQWINDSKGTNVGATIAAVQGMDGPVILIAGGQAKGQDFSPLTNVVREKARIVLLFGEDAELIRSAISDAVESQIVGSLEEAVAVAAQNAEPGDRVLLSPACASFDMFNNYQQRGEKFMQIVKETIGA